MAKYAPPPIREPIFIGRIIQKVWVQFFQSLWEKTEQTVRQDSFIGSDAFDTPQNYSKRLDELELKINSISSIKTYDTEINDIERLVISESYRPKAKKEEAWPVGSIFISVSATNPKDLLGYGTWVAFGTGKVLIGIDTGDVDFDTAEETGGAKTHDHAATASGAPSATVVIASGTGATVSTDTHTHSTDLAAINHMPPFIAVYFFKRTA